MVAGLLAGAALAGCTSAQPGRAEPAPGGEATAGSPRPSAPSSPTPTVEIPPRPRELKLDGVEPCTLFTKAQLDQLAVNLQPRSRTDDSGAYKGMRKCVLNVQNQPPFYHYNVTAITNEGIEAWLTGKRNVEARLTDVTGFASATYWLRGARDRNAQGCTTSVDVTEGQQLMVDTNNDGGRSFTLEQMCQRAEQAAALAIQTLQTLR